jgi:protein-disulfide isomerase
MTKIHRSTKRAILRRRGSLSITGTAALSVLGILLLVLIGACSGNNEGESGTNSAEPGIGITEDGFPYKGAPNAPVKVIEYSDYLCGHCRNFALEKDPLITEEYVDAGKVQYVYQYYALGNAQVLLGEAAHCAADQDRFWEYHKIMFENQGQFGSVETIEDLQLKLTEFAELAELDVADFEECWISHQHQQTIIDSVLAARDKGVGGTPTISVQGELIVGNQPYDVFKEAIENALAEAQ